MMVFDRTMRATMAKMMARKAAVLSTQARTSGLLTRDAVLIWDRNDANSQKMAANVEALANPTTTNCTQLAALRPVTTYKPIISPTGVFV